MNMQPRFPVLAHQDIICQLADLLVYGLVGACDPQPVPTPPNGDWWLADDQASAAPRFHQISAPLRQMALTQNAPIADSRLLGALIAMVGAVPVDAPVTLYLPAQEPSEDYRPYLTRRAAQKITHCAKVLREQRRQKLGLSVGLPAAELDAAIYAAFFLPMARSALASVLPNGARLSISATPPPDGASRTGFAPLALAVDDPVSDNVFALAMRIGFHGQKSAVVLPFVKLSPFQFGLKLRASSAVTETMRRVALSVPQLCLLSNCNLKGDAHV